MKFHHKTVLTLSLAACFATTVAQAAATFYCENDRCYTTSYSPNGQYYSGSGYLLATNINGLGNRVANNKYDYAFAGLGNDEQSYHAFSAYDHLHTQLQKDSMLDKVAMRESAFARVAIFDTGVDLNSPLISNRFVDKTMTRYDSDKKMYVQVATQTIEWY